MVQWVKLQLGAPTFHIRRLVLAPGALLPVYLPVKASWELIGDDSSA